jgi:heat shock protein HspQ
MKRIVIAMMLLTITACNTHKNRELNERQALYECKQVNGADTKKAQECYESLESQALRRGDVFVSQEYTPEYSNDKSSLNDILGAINAMTSDPYYQGITVDQENQMIADNNRAKLMQQCMGLGTQEAQETCKLRITMDMQRNCKITNYNEQTANMNCY